MHSGTLIQDLLAAVERAEQVTQVPAGRTELSMAKTPSLAENEASRFVTCHRDGARSSSLGAT
jgi:hypothetical protein